MVFVFYKYGANILQPKRPFCDICHTSTLNYYDKWHLFSNFCPTETKTTQKRFFKHNGSFKKNNPPWMLSSLSRLSLRCFFCITT